MLCLMTRKLCGGLTRLARSLRIGEESWRTGVYHFTYFLKLGKRAGHALGTGAVLGAQKD